MINVTVTDKVPDKLLKKMKTMGIDTSKLKLNLQSDKSDQVAPKTKQFQVESSATQDNVELVNQTL